MNHSSLEITENEYCIKLNKDTFDLTLIRQLISRIQSEQRFFSTKKNEPEEDIISRSADYERDEIFDRLSDK